MAFSVKHGTDMQQVAILAEELTSFNGGDGAERLKQFLMGLQTVSQKGQNLKEVHWQLTIGVKNNDATKAYEFYINPGILGLFGDDGIVKAIGTPFSGIGAPGSDKLEAISLSTLPYVYLRWLNLYATYSKSVSISANSVTQINNGYLKYSEINPASETGIGAYTDLRLSQYNTSTAQQGTKAEIYNHSFLMSEQNLLKGNVLPNGEITFIFNLVSMVPDIFASVFNK